jgi:4-hydroxy-4-methyl-2-oxoglutarate aldolase
MHDIGPLYRGARVIGPAYTVLCHPNDNLIVHYAVKFARPGDVLVIATGSHTASSAWGELLSLSAKQRGLAGVVTDGSSRDRSQIETIGFPVYARSVTPQGTFKQCAGSVNVPVSCAGVSVSPGDLIVGDDDGVVVVPFESIETILSLAGQASEKEREMRHRILNGEVMYDFLKLDDILGPLLPPCSSSERE